jgi:hypothetical protein
MLYMIVPLPDVTLRLLLLLPCCLADVHSIHAQLIDTFVDIAPDLELGLGVFMYDKSVSDGAKAGLLCFHFGPNKYLDMDSSAYAYVGLVNQNLVFLFSYHHISHTDELFLDLLHL